MQRCQIQTGEQMTELLQRFATLVSLKKASATEEVRMLLLLKATASVLCIV